MTYDINIQLNPTNTNLQLYSFGFKRTIGVKGIQKLVNIFAKYLLTPVGSDPLNLQYGTNLVSLIGSNTDPIDAQDILTLAVNKTVGYIYSIQQSADIPTDERLYSGTVTKYVVFTDISGFAAQILIRNVANQGLNLILPTLEVR